ncbi:MAG: S41 family peptidase [Bacteroidales bacterium]
MHRYRFVSVAAILVLVCAIIGGLWGRSVLATPEDRLPEQYKVFTTALAAVESGYVEKLPSERLVYGSISGMLQTLDPHSTFLDPKYYAQLRERQEGHYYGLGLSILGPPSAPQIQVVSLFEGSPAYKKGIRRGDVIAKIAGEDTDGWTSDQAVKKLKGPKGTFVHIALRRQGHDELIEMDVMRDDIKIPSVPAHFMISPDTGYVKVLEFAENTDDELGAALQYLSSKGMKRVLLDLRQNPGGPLDQAIRVANRFLPQGDLIVYTRGRVSNSDADYRAMEKSEYTKLPLVVLVNRNSASASEIVSGALQDHDRGLIVGETTFGKALVQSVYHISEGAGLALTTARYYTPSGRLIQRPWDATFDEYSSYTAKDQTAERPHPPNELFHTEANRPVWGGGGIEPDKRFDGPIEGFNPTRLGRTVYARQLFASFAEQFVAAGDTRIAAQKNARVVSRNFQVDDAMLRDFKAYVASQKPAMTMDEAEFAKDAEFMRAMIHFEVDAALFGVSDARRNLIAKDPQAQYGLSLFPEAEKLLTLVKVKTAKAQ